MGRTAAQTAHANTSLLANPLIKGEKKEALKSPSVQNKIVIFIISIPPCLVLPWDILKSRVNSRNFRALASWGLENNGI